MPTDVPAFVPPAPSTAAPIFRPPSVAQQESEMGKAFPGFREFVALRNRGSDLQKRIDALTVELKDVRKGAASTEQKVQLHQINNALHRAGYEMDTLVDEYQRRFSELIEDMGIDWKRTKSNWIQNEDQIFILQMLQAKCIFLKQGGDQFGTPEPFKECEELEEQLDQFANSHLSAGSLPDDTLIHFGQLVSTLSRILVSAHEVANEVPDWRATLLKPPEGGLSVEFLKKTMTRIQERMKQIPQDIIATRRLLPGGSWRKESDLRPEIYGFASLLYPNDQIHKIQVRDTLMYLDDDPDARLRKVQVAELKQDEQRCKEWLDAHAQHARLIEKSKALAKEGNYKKAEKFVGQAQATFSDLNYGAYNDDAKPWRDEIKDIDSRLSIHLEEARKILGQVFQRIWLAFGRFSAVQELMEKTKQALEKETRALRSFSGTDFYEDAQVPIEELRRKRKEIEDLYENSLRMIRLIALVVALGVAAVLGGVGALISYHLRAMQAAMNIEVRQLDANDPMPTIVLARLPDPGDSEAEAHAFSVTTNAWKASFPQLHKGNYALTVSAPNFETFAGTVTVLPSKTTKVEPISLVPINGFLRLEAAPGGYSYIVRPMGEDRQVEAGSLNEDDAANLTIRPGRYDVTFAQGNHQFHVPIEVTARNISSYGPDFRFSHVRVESDPSGAMVSLNGNELGPTPLETTLPPTDNSLEVKLDGYQTQYFPVKPAEGKPLTFNVTLEKVGPLPNPPPPTNESIPQFIPRPDPEVK